ncbi:MAG: Dabb family protein [Muribaculaceae bacterium]|nr:Dabb family protein [Muribaculaceae bacterium]
MIKHTVTFKLKGTPEERREAATRFAAALDALPAVIPQLLSIETGVNINPAESWDVTLTATAATLDDVAAYSAHPAHLAAVAIIAGCKEERACVDYEV